MNYQHPLLETRWGTPPSMRCPYYPINKKLYVCSQIPYNNLRQIFMLGKQASLQNRNCLNCMSTLHSYHRSSYRQTPAQRIPHHHPNGTITTTSLPASIHINFYHMRRWRVPRAPMHLRTRAWDRRGMDQSLDLQEQLHITDYGINCLDRGRRLFGLILSCNYPSRYSSM